MQLREIADDIKRVERKHGNDMDAYSRAHLAEARSQIERALDAQYLYNTDDIGGGGMDLGFLFMQENESAKQAD